MKVSITPFDTSFIPPSTRSIEHSPPSGPASDDENVHGIEVSPKKENTRKKDLKVFDFDLSGDEDDVGQVGSGLKKTKVNHRGSHQSKKPVTSKKQTLLRQYMGMQSTTGSTSRGLSKKSNDSKDVKAVKSSDGATKKKVSTSQTATDHDVRNTISKLLASKAEELAAKASTQGAQKGYTGPEASATTTSSTSLDEAAAPVSEETGEPINRRIKRKNPLATTAAAAKRAPPKRARMEREEDPEVVILDSVSSQASASNISPLPSESSQTKQSGAKKNGLRGTLEKSEIALRTRSSRKSQGHDTRDQEMDQKAETPKGDVTLSDSQPLSIAESDAYSPLPQEPDLGLTDSPKSSVSSNSEVCRGGRPSPRYTARGRRLSNLSPDVKAEQATRAASTVSGLGTGVRQATSKQASEGEYESDPYSLDEDSTMDKAYLKKQHLIPPVSTCSTL